MLLWRCYADGVSLTIFRIGVGWGGMLNVCVYLLTLAMLRWWCHVEDDVSSTMLRVGLGLTAQVTAKGKRQSLESKAAYIHVLLYVPKKIERSLERHWSTLQSQQVKKHLEQSWFWGATSKTSADVGQNACGPPEFIWNELDDTRICSKNCLKPEFCKDCGIATPKKQPGRYAAAYLCLFHMGSLKGSERSPYNSVNNPRFIHIIYQWYSDISLVTKKNVSTFQL